MFFVNSLSGGSLPSPSHQPVKARQHNNIHQATTTVLMPPFTPLPVSPFPDSIQELDHLPPYHVPTDLNSPSPSLISSSVDGSFPSTPAENQYLFPGSSPGGRGLDHDLNMYNRHGMERIRMISTPSIHTNDTFGSVDVDMHQSKLHLRFLFTSV